jgi:hypothetical protein
MLFFMVFLMGAVTIGICEMGSARTQRRSGTSGVAYAPAFASFTNLKPTWSLPLLVSPRPRVPTM